MTQNSSSSPISSPWTSSTPGSAGGASGDRLGSPDAVPAWLARAGLMDGPGLVRFRGDLPAARELLTEAWRLRDAVLEAVTAWQRGAWVPDGALLVLNRTLEASRDRRRLRRTDARVHLETVREHDGPAGGAGRRGAGGRGAARLGRSLAGTALRRGGLRALVPGHLPQRQPALVLHDPLREPGQGGGALPALPGELIARGTISAGAALSRAGRSGGSSRMPRSRGPNVPRTPRRASTACSPHWSRCSQTHAGGNGEAAQVRVGGAVELHAPAHVLQREGVSLLQVRRPVVPEHGPVGVEVEAAPVGHHARGQDRLGEVVAAPLDHHPRQDALPLDEVARRSGGRTRSPGTPPAASPGKR